MQKICSQRKFCLSVMIVFAFFGSMHTAEDSENSLLQRDVGGSNELLVDCEKFFAATPLMDVDLSDDAFACAAVKAPTQQQTGKPTVPRKIAILVPSTGNWHMQKHDELHKYFQNMSESFKQFGVALEVFKDWHLPAVIKDFVHYRLDRACNSGAVTDQLTIDSTRKAQMLIQAAVPDQVQSGIETGWRADHRIVAAQALAIMLAEQKAAGNIVTVIGLGIGGGQIVAGASKLLGCDIQEYKSLAVVLGELGNAMQGFAPFLGPYAPFLLWMAKATNFASRAAEIMKNDKFLWQAAEMPVAMYKKYLLQSASRTSFVIDKLITVASPVGLEHFQPNIGVVKQYYNLFGEADLKCKFAGNKIKITDPDAGVINLSVHFGHGLIPAMHKVLLNSTSLARAIPYLHEHLANAAGFKFGVPDCQLMVNSDKEPYFRVKSKGQIS